MSPLAGRDDALEGSVAHLADSSSRTDREVGLQLLDDRASRSSAPVVRYGRTRRGLVLKAYTFHIGKGSGEAMETVAFSQELFADSLGEAVDKARALTRARLPHADEDTVHILDETRLEEQMLWSRSAEEIRTT